MKVIRRFSEFINESAIEVTPRSADSFVTILDKYDGEKEVGNNGGAMVEGFLKTIGLSKGQPWCQAFVYAVFDEFTKSKGISNPLPKTGSVLSHWKQAPESNKIKTSDIKVGSTAGSSGNAGSSGSSGTSGSSGSSGTSGPKPVDSKKVQPGQVFIKTRQGGGHTGIVLKVDGESFISIDGNSSDKVKINKYKIKDMLGFVDYFQNQEFSDAFVKAASSLISKSSVGQGGGKET